MSFSKQYLDNVVGKTIESVESDAIPDGLDARSIKINFTDGSFIKINTWAREKIEVKPFATFHVFDASGEIVQEKS